MDKEQLERQMETLLLSANATMIVLNGCRQLQLLQSQSRHSDRFFWGLRGRHCSSRKDHNRSQFIVAPAALRMLMAVVIDEAPRTRERAAVFLQNCKSTLNFKVIIDLYRKKHTVKRQFHIVSRQSSGNQKILNLNFKGHLINSKVKSGAPTPHVLLRLVLLCSICTAIVGYWHSVKGEDVFVCFYPW